MRTAILITAALSLGGCSWMYEEDDGGGAALLPGGDPAGNLQIENAYLEGDLGDVRGFAGGVWLQEGYSYEGFSGVEIQARGGEGAVMTMLSIEGGLDHPDVRPGAVLDFRGFEAYDYDAGAQRLYVSALGCSGGAPGDWAYDQNADNVRLNVLEGAEPDTLRIEFTASFRHDGGIQTVYGEFAVR
jgi:hypothetical protein